MNDYRKDDVGPVLSRDMKAQHILAAIRELNENIRVIDRGAYVRVLVPGKCVLTRQAVETAAGFSVQWPQDLEAVMPSFKGKMQMTEDVVTWSAKDVER